MPSLSQGEQRGVGVALVAAAIFAGPLGVAAVSGSTAFGLGAMGGSMLIGSASSARNAGGIRGRLATVSSPVPYRRRVYGDTRLGGDVVWAGLSGPQRENLNLVLALADHEIEAVDTVFIDNEAVPLDGNGDATGRFVGAVHAEFTTGTTSQAALTGLIAETRPAWLNAGDGLRFNGRNQYCEIAANSNLSPAVITVEAQVQPLKLPDSGETAVLLWRENDWELRLDAAGTVTFTDSAGTTVTSATALTLFRFTHVAVIGNATNLRIFINATLDATTGTPYSGGAGGSEIVRFAAQARETRLYFGDLDSVRIWDDARTEDELFGNKDADVGGSTAGLIGQWKFDEGSGATAADSDTTNSNDATLIGPWTSAHQGKGIAYAWVRLTWNPELFPNGLPELTFQVRGAKVYDTRTSTTGYSANAALCVADYLANGTFGLGAGTGALDTTEVNAAANVCDESVSLKGGGSENRYEINGSFRADATPRRILEQLVGAMAGHVRRTGAAWAVLAGEWRASAVTLDEDDLWGPVEPDVILPATDQFNTVRGTFPDPGSDYQPHEFPEVQVAGYLAADQGVERVRELSFPFTTSAATAQRLARIMLEKARREIRLSLTAHLRASQVLPAETLAITRSLLGWSAKTFEVRTGHVQPVTGSEVPAWAYTLFLAELDANAFAWTPASDEAELATAPRTNLPSIFDPIEPPGGVALASGAGQLFVRKDGTIWSRIHVTWTAPEEVFVQRGGHIEVQYKRNADADWQGAALVRGDVAEAYVTDVEDGVAYDVRVRSVTSYGAVSDWETVTAHTVVGKTATPSDVASVNAAVNGAFVDLGWPDITDVDLAGYVIRYAETTITDWGRTVALDETDRSTSKLTAKLPPGTWRVFVRAKDTSKNLSDNAATTSVTVPNLNSAIDNTTGAERWPGTADDYVLHPHGWWIPDSTDNPAADDFALFEPGVPSAEADSRYTSEELILSIAGDVRLYTERVSKLLPGEAGPTGDFAMEVRIDPDGSGYGAWEPWPGVGTRTVKKAQARITATNTSELRAVLQNFRLFADEPPRHENGTVSVPAGGSQAVTFTAQFFTTPRVVLTPQGSTAVSPGFDGLTTSGFTARAFDSDGNPVAATLNWRAETPT